MSLDMRELISTHEVINFRKEIEILLDKVDDQRNSMFRLIQKIMKMTVRNKKLSDTDIDRLNTVKLKLRTPVSLKFDLPEHDRVKLGFELDTLEKMSQTINNMMISLNMWSEEIVKYDLSLLNEHEIKTLEKFGDQLFNAEKYLDLRMTDMGRLENSEYFRNLD